MFFYVDHGQRISYSPSMNLDNRRMPNVSAQSSPGLTLDLRQRIGQRRSQLGLSLRGLGKQVGVSAAQLQRIESGSKHPTPSLLLRILAELEFGEAEFAEALAESPEGWLARRLASLSPDRISLAAVLREGRKQAGLALDDLARLSGVSIRRLMELESGHASASPGLLAKLVRVWRLPLETLQSLLPTSTGSAGGVAERFLIALLEQQGFEVTAEPYDFGLCIRLGGDWYIQVRAKLEQKPKKHEAKP